GMGVVYKARQPALERLVAVKTLRACGPEDAENRQRFLREARAVARLQHPNLVQLYEIGEAPGEHGTTLPYFVMEYMAGGNLARFLHGVSQPPREAAQFLEILALAVHHAHEHGIVHRDLKPANVLLQRQPETQYPRSEKENAERPSHFQLRIS